MLAGLIVGVVIIIIISVFVALYNHAKEKEVVRAEEEEEELRLMREMPNRTEYFIKGNLKKVVLNSNKLYIRQTVGKFYNCKDIKSVKIGYQVNNEVVHYEDPHGAMKMGVVAGIASWFGVSTISDLSSLGEDVLEKRLTIYIKIEINEKTLNLCAIDQIVNDEALIHQVEELLKFVDALNRIVQNNYRVEDVRENSL